MIIKENLQSLGQIWMNREKQVEKNIQQTLHTTLKTFCESSNKCFPN